MVVARGVNMMDVEKVLKETQIFALHMVEGGVISASNMVPCVLLENFLPKNW
jgi:hypothetical protein